MTDAGYFDELYAERDDPWDLSSSDYERHKLALLLASLPHARYRLAFEPGCAIGVTTEALAGRCDRIIAMDGSPSAVHQTRDRLAGADHVSAVLGRVPADWPAESFDLIVVSELLYYLDDDARLAVAGLASQTLAPDGHVMAVHWRHPFREAHVTGDQVHAELADRLRSAGLAVVTCQVEEDFLLDCYQRV